MKVIDHTEKSLGTILSKRAYGWYVELQDNTWEGPYKKRSEAREALSVLKSVKQLRENVA